MKWYEIRRHGYAGMQALVAAASLYATGGSALADTTLLTPWHAIAGARMDATRTAPSPPQLRPELAGHLAWLFPTAIAVRGSSLYVADAGRRRIFRYDLGQQTMTAFADYSANNGTSLAVASDLSLYVADPGTQTILHFSWDGRLLQTFGNARELARPVAVAVDEVNGEVLVADGLYNQVTVFNSLGRLLDVIQTPQTRSIAAMTRGPQGLYLVDRIGRQIVVLGRNGLEREVFGADTLKDPAAIVVDRFNRAFVAENFDNTIKIYQDDHLVETFGGSGTTPGRFNRISSLWLDQNILYVADSLNGRVQSFLVAPPGKGSSSQ